MIETLETLQSSFKSGIIILGVLLIVMTLLFNIDLVPLIVATVFTEIIEKYRNQNKLFKCSVCHKYFREYQTDMKECIDEKYKRIKDQLTIEDLIDENTYYKEAKKQYERREGMNCCIHCSSIHTSPVSEEEIENRKWLKYSTDAPELSYKKYKQWQRAKKKIKMHNEEIAKIDDFMEYNNMTEPRELLKTIQTSSEIKSQKLTKDDFYN